MKSSTEIKAIGAGDANIWLNESPETLQGCLENPQGWDESLINGIGSVAVAKLFEVVEGSDLYFEALKLYNQGADEAARQYDKAIA